RARAAGRRRALRPAGGRLRAESRGAGAGPAERSVRLKPATARPCDRAPENGMTALRSRRGKASVIETELKFEVDPARAEALRAALLAQGAETLDLAAHYFDSQDGRLAAAGIALRLRREGQHWLQTVKASRDAQAFERLEHTLRREAPAPDAVLAPEPALHAGSAVGAPLARALGEPAPELQERYAVLVTRLQLRQCGDRAEVELAFDTGRVQGGGREAPVCELEFEL